METYIPFLLTENETESTYAPHKTYRYVLSKVKAFVEDKMKTTVTAYFLDIQDRHYIIRKARAQNSEYVLWAKMDETEAQKALVDGEMVNTYANALYYSETFDVAFGYFYRYSTTDVNAEAIIYAKNDESVKAFLSHIRSEQRAMADKEIHMFTDTDKGISAERKTINQTVKREEVIMDQSIKTEIFTMIDGFFEENDNFFKKYNIPHRRGILLHGKPGNGKTTIVKSLVDSLVAPVIYWQVNEFTTSASISQVFEKAENLAPAVLVIEDLDSLPGNCRSTFLNMLDGATAANGIFLIGTTNYPERVDDALKNRPGRFDRIYEVELPNSSLRSEYMRVRGYLDFITEEELTSLIDKTSGFSFVQLNEVFISMAFSAHTSGKADYESIITQIQKANANAKKNSWSKTGDSKVGFTN
jgi:AAA+ superfamily predicted ATPase